MGNPPPPWRLIGEAIVLPRLIDARRARLLVPDYLEIIRVLPGRTLGGLILARYVRGSTIEYSELISVPAIVRQGSAWGIWVSHIYVDDERSLAAGQAIWGLPKDMATFRWRDDGKSGCAVEHEGRILCSVEWRAPAIGIPIRGRIPALTFVNGEFARFVASGRAWTGATNAAIDIPNDSPLSAILESGKSRALSMRLAVDVAAPLALPNGA